jgi:peptidyl-prolyl cis-trans isomerase D
MLVWVRKLLENWVARGFFALLVVVFVFWGISNVVTLIGSDTAVANVNGQAVDVAQVQAAYQQALTQAEQTSQGQPDLATRQQLAGQALAGVLRQVILRQEEQHLGVAVPDAAVHDVLAAIPSFQTNGVFDKDKFAQALQNNNSSPDMFIAQTKDQIAGRQLIGPVVGGAAAPDEALDQIFAYAYEQRSAQTVSIATSAQATPPAPSDDVLQRYWRNHPSQFTAPEYRRVELVILSPALLAPSEQVAQADVDAAYARAAAAQPPATPVRSAQVLLVQDLADSSRLQTAWRHGANWDEIQAMAAKYNATPVPVDNAQQSQIPNPDLAQAIFSATPGQVVGPVAGTDGMYVFKVTQAGQNGPDAATLRAQVTQQLQLQKAQADVAQDVDGVQDALAGQTPLDQLPGNLGLTAVEGTLDANGNTPEGTAAPIPGGDDMKAAVVKAAFAAHVGDPAQLQNGPDGSYFALSVEQVLPPALAAYDQVKAKVLTAWTQDQQSRAAETQAAALMHAVNAGQSLSAAAASAGLQVTTTPAVTRSAPPSGIDSQMVSMLFTLKPGQAGMEPTASGFTVTALANIVDPQPEQDPTDLAQLQQSLTTALQQDVSWSLMGGLQTRDNVSVNQKLFSQIYQ